MCRGLLILAAALAAAPIAWAGDLSVRVVDLSGAPVSDAVVTLPASGAAPRNFPWKMEMAQQGKAFRPFVLIVPVGASVEFPNLDKFRHHVYSFSKGNRFELELYGREEERTVTFRNEGVAALGCNIHDEMIGYIRVVDTPYAAKSDAEGAARITNAPDGEVTLTVWHPLAKGREQTIRQTIDVSAAGETEVTVVIDVPAQG